MAGITDDLKIKDLLEKELSENKKREVGPWSVEQTNANLHKKKEFEPFCRVISAKMYSISKDIMEYDENYFMDITAMWGNRQPKGAFFRMHSHHNNIFSGVFYPDENKDFPKISFHRPFRSDFAPTVSKSNTYNGGLSGMECKKDLLIIFPSWLNHNIPVNTSDKDRLSISFNVMFRGIFGETTSNQSTLF